MTYSRTFPKGSTLALALTAMCLPTLAFGACQDVRDRIAQNIESNGVEHMGYSLEVIPTADADQAEGQIVGHCENNQYQIVYKRHYRTSSAETMEDVSADEDEIDGASSKASDNASSETPEPASSQMDDAETSTPDQTDDMSTSNSRRVETSDMPVNSDAS
ncbi:hypothetical protein GCM10010082_09990 [Kushneria pakistanensis]|uniref:DUF1161 domain-containing protein n=1 Tax=Kushneria pakistanensis TaxID=1508770 RepID=A0ABQ3FE89_9GAMM|nr:DUF1161 domain-containing protein [Kushneria pakistanensis]GHC20168.1 hypothetical protein GCM10010082_09990 [Kushneria pakistanensis]